MNSPHDILAQGLLATFAGTNEVSKVSRGAFALVGTEATPASGTHYIDQWVVKRTGAGQEIAKEGEAITTRSYAGGVVADDVLSELGITGTDVIATLKSMLQRLGDKTRLLATVSPVANGDWQYRYTVTDTYPDVSLTIGVETITYKQKTVFVHAFLLADVV